MGDVQCKDLTSEKNTAGKLIKEVECVTGVLCKPILKEICMIPQLGARTDTDNKNHPQQKQLASHFFHLKTFLRVSNIRSPLLFHLLLYFLFLQFH